MENSTTANQASVGILRRWSEWLYDHRLLAGIAILLMTAFFAWNLRHLDISTHFSDLYPRNHPYTKTFEKYPDFGSPFTVALVVQVKKGTVYNPETLHKIQEATKLVDLIKGVDHNQVLSIASRRVKHIEATIDGVHSGNLLFGKVFKSPEEIELLRQKIRSTPGVIGTFVSRQEDAALIQVTFIEHLVDYNVIFNDINSVIKKLEDDNHDVYAAGQPLLIGWVYYYQNEMYMIFGVGLLAMVVLLAFYFRNIAGVVAPLVVGGVSAIWGFGFAGLLGFNLDPLIIVVPVLLVARALSHSVQMCERYFEVYHAEREGRKASVESLVSLFPPGTVGIICDASGLFIIAIAPIPIVYKLAYVCGLWSVTLIITAIVLSFILLSYLPLPRNVEEIVLTSDRKKKGVLYRIFNFITFFSSTRRRAVTTSLFFVGVAVLGVYLGSHREIGDVHPGTSLLWPTSPYNTAVKRINERFAGFDLLQVVAEEDYEGALMSPEGFGLMERFQRYMEQDPEVGGTLSFADYVPQVNRLFHGGLPRWEVIPTKSDDVPQFAHLAMTGAGPDDFDRYVTKGFTAASISIWFKDHKGKTIEQAIKRAQEYKDAEKYTTKKGVELRLASGSMGLLGAINETVTHMEPLTVTLISLIIFLVTSYIYRSFTAGLLLVLISNIALYMTLTIMYIKGIGLDVNTFPIAAVGMGIGIDYNIYLMSRMCEEYRLNPDYAVLIPSSIFTTGKAIFFTATTMVGGIILWFFMSSLRFQADMGFLLSAVMLAHVVLALFFQAAVMQILRPEFIKRGLFYSRKGDQFHRIAMSWVEKFIYKRKDF